MSMYSNEARSIGAAIDNLAETVSEESRDVLRRAKQNLSELADQLERLERTANLCKPADFNANKEPKNG